MNDVEKSEQETPKLRLLTGRNRVGRFHKRVMAVYATAKRSDGTFTAVGRLGSALECRLTANPKETKWIATKNANEARTLPPIRTRFSRPSPGTPRGLFLLGTPRGVSPLIGDGPSLSLYTMLFVEALRLSA